MKVVVIIQARMGSTRLPGKVMKRIADKTVLEHVVDRLKKSREVDEIVIATTPKEEDNIIAVEATRLGVKYFKGSEDDVLSRYYFAAKENNAEVIVRVTSDCPLIDAEVMDNMIRIFKTTTCDYLSNTITRTYPRGLDCEIFSFQVLETSFNKASENYQREHVTPYIYENDQLFKIEQYLDDEDNSYIRCTLDTTEDFEVIKRTLESINVNNYSYTDLLVFFRKNPHIISLNSDVAQKNLRG
ncbi:cytidylyltransferase domain-containing protein [Paenibacillus cremeus]|uniref:Acylneuraminate cytidylyltransferase n=1 Tax=Paenibacillus cremeus TaxID=2163881 RepID=A0A559K4Z1_9BACL|nr:glycosyltransferase family protein [Paenibacillus cremeus]TVY07208.1 acylneuraminate cytidylyltransferase [Paenibacillus cremeus]